MATRMVKKPSGVIIFHGLRLLPLFIERAGDEAALMSVARAADEEVSNPKSHAKDE